MGMCGGLPPSEGFPEGSRLGASCDRGRLSRWLDAKEPADEISEGDHAHVVVALAVKSLPRRGVSEWVGLISRGAGRELADLDERLSP